MFNNTYITHDCFASFGIGISQHFIFGQMTE